MSRRDKTRDQRHAEKLRTAEFNKIELATVSFQCDSNLGFLIRAAGCFGSPKVHVIGSVPSYKEQRRLSGGLNNYVKVEQWRNTSQFLVYVREQKKALLSLELNASAISIYDFKYDYEQDYVLFTGHETTGVPAEVVAHSQPIYIPMPGVGFCLNTSQAANVALFEYNRQLNIKHNGPKV